MVSELCTKSEKHRRGCIYTNSHREHHRQYQNTHTAATKNALLPVLIPHDRHKRVTLHKACLHGTDKMNIATADNVATEPNATKGDDAMRTR